MGFSHGISLKLHLITIIKSDYMLGLGVNKCGNNYLFTKLGAFPQNMHNDK